MNRFRKLLSLIPKDTYPIFFLFLLAILFHSLYVFKDYNLSVNMDAINQFAFFFPHLVESFAAGDYFWSWSYGLGGDLFGEFAYYYTTSPLFYLAVAAEMIFDFDWSILGTIQFKLYLSILKSFLSMLGMYLLIRYEKFERWKATIAAICYGSSIIFFIHAALIDYFTETFIYVPLAIFGLLYYQRSGKSRFFILGIFLSIISNFYMGFINSIFFGLAVLMLTPLKRNKDQNIIRTFLNTYTPYLLHYLIGLGLSFVGFLPGILAVASSDRLDSETIVPPLFYPEWYLAIPEHIWSDAGYLGLPFITIIGFFLISAFLDNYSKRKSVLVIILLFFYLIPYMYSVFNGFSSIQFRWFHIINFAVAFALPNWITSITNNRGLHIKHIFVIGIASFFILYTKEPRLSSVTDKYDWGIISFGLISLIVLILLAKTSSNIKKRALSVILVFTVACNALVNVTGFQTEQVLQKWGAVNLTDEYFEQPSLDNVEEKKIFSQLVPHKSEFYRTFYLNDHRLNNAMLHNYYGTNAYNSVLKKNIHTFVKKDYNVLQKNPLRNGVVVSTYSMFDQRWALETGLGVKYQVLNKDIPKPFDYELIRETDHYNVYENKSAVGLDMWYTETMAESDWLELNPAQRDALFLNTLVLPDSAAKEKANNDWKQYLPKEVAIDNKEIFFEKSSLKDNHLIIKEGGKLVLPLDINQVDGEYLVYFEVSPISDQAMTLNVNGKEVLKRESSYIYTYNNEGYVFQLPGDTKNIEVNLPPGEYKLKDIKVYWNSYENFKEQASAREKYMLKKLKVDGSDISGEISVGEDGILFLSIPYHENWGVKVNGKESKLLEVQGSLSGIPLKAGDYHIELTYITPGFYTGLIVTVTSGMLSILLYFYSRRKRY